jgi:HEAT repeat protein
MGTIPASSEAKYLNKGPEVWVENLGSEDPLVRRAAVYALGEIGPQAGSAASQVRRLLKDKESFIRVWAANAVAKIEPKKKQDAIATLEKGLEDPAGFVRSLSASFLGALGSDCDGIQAVLPALERCLKDPDQSVRGEAALAIKRIRGRGVRA